jgi:alkylation response protein AidB-like acyl-CoA dehydrogenase
MECAEAETAFALQGLGTYPILQSGSAQLAATWAPKVARGEAVAAFALSEPQAGSDPGALSLSAERRGEDWLLSGEKTWISNAPDADFYCVFARSSEAPGAKGITAFVVPRGAPGLSGQPIPMLAPHAIGSLTFDGVPVPDSFRVGEVGEGFKVAMRTLDLFRPSVGACAVGMAQAALDLAVDWAKQRQAFGKPLKDHQAIAHRLADMWTRTQAARLLVYAAAAAYDHGGARNTKNAAMAKLFATETAQEVVDFAIQVFGARALQQDHPLAHLYLEVRAPRIYEGTSEIQREILARELFNPRG